ncbi:ferredoxin-type protein NapF [Sphaerotilus microaerophilus]|uniref:4Fe-4S ferredoxin-type domain-containing protein n=1 Tax=Sphaerotilus microaerophilus TaxID=2914710 RepID=A0ABM7YSY5_9BURK|nr:ferredoxin-type protein NapF [Sphaerotilus sp. FB-5]BDI07724.1 hypothetical protein CATMQ487_46940 [Sphaerotilus sp. FB-5]
MDPRRRFFLRAAARPAELAAARVPQPRPPWALRPDAAFTERCSRCGDCVRACPRGLLAAGGFPVLSFARQGCDECGACRSACTTGAIVPAATATPPAFTWRVAIGTGCLAQHRVECRLCADACDARALRFVPALGGVAQLRIDTEACTGCGECVSLCPVAAITMAEPAPPAATAAAPDRSTAPEADHG